MTQIKRIGDMAQNRPVQLYKFGVTLSFRGLPRNLFIGQTKRFLAPKTALGMTMRQVTCKG